MPALSIQIREAVPADAEVLVQFNTAMARETEGKTLLPEQIGPGVKAVLAHPENGFYLVAEVSGQVAGALLVTTEWSDWLNGRWWWLQSVYVSPPFRRRGLYRALYEGVKARAAAQPEVCGCRLYAERDNRAAQETYRRLGMEQTRYLVFEERFGPDAPDRRSSGRTKWYFRQGPLMVAVLAVGPLALPLVWWHPCLSRGRKAWLTILVLLFSLMLCGLFALLVWQSVVLYRMALAW